MIKSYKKIWKLLPLLVFGLLGLNLLLLSHKVQAFSPTSIGSQAPIGNSAQTDPGNTAYTPWMAVGVGAYNGPASVAKAYTRVNSTLQIHQAPCTMQDVGSPQTEYYVFRMRTDPNNPKPVNELFVDQVGDSGLLGPATCGQVKSLPLNNGIPSGLPGHAGWATFYIIAVMYNPPGSDNERSFRFSVDNGGLVGLSRTEGCGNNHNPCDASDIAAYTGIYSRNLGTSVGPSADMWDYAVQFAPRCYETIGPGTSFSMYDMDPGVYSPQNLETAIQRDDRTNSTFNWATDPTSNPNPKGSFNGANGGSGNFDSMSFTSSQLYRYRFLVGGVSWRNTLQLYVPYDQFDAQASVGQACSPKPAAKCTATPTPLLPGGGVPISMKVVLTNTSSPNGPTYNPTYEVRQISYNGSPAGLVRSLSTNVPPGATDNGIQPFTPIAGRPAGTTVTFYYALFDSAGNKIPNGNLPYSCFRTVQWGCTVNCNPSGPPGTGRFEVACGLTTAADLTSNATYPQTTWVQPGSYQTTQKPVNYPNQPYIFVPSPPPNAGGNPFGLPTYTYTPLPVPQTGPAPATRIPIHIQFFDTNNTFVGEKYDVLGVPGNQQYNTFVDFGTLWPHLAYRATLDAQTTGDLGPNQDGPYTYNQHFEDTSLVGDCLHASCGNMTNAADVEPGQTAHLSGGIDFSNSTQQSFATNSTGGYYMHIEANPGIYNAPGDPAPTTGSIGTNNSTVSAFFDGRIDYSGTFSVTFMFQGNPLGLPDLDIPCTSPPIAPGTRPYLQVWGGDINTGGGFESQNPVTGALSCGSGYPDYVSPSTTAKNNSGGIKAFGYTDGAGEHGSLSDLGALSLGLIANQPSAQVNFGAQAKFSNTIYPNGQLNSSPPDYCITDFFDSRQKSPAPLDIPPPAQISSLSGYSTDQYIVGRTSRQNVDNFGGGTVPGGTLTTPGRKITLYVNGDLNITGNITYGNWTPDNPDSAPSFTVIVKGNINISPNVTHIDGLYIAQPSSPGNGGEFNTCADNSGNQFCNKQFVANGAVIARLVKPLRAVGTLSPDANPAFSPAPGHLPAEIFNFMPSMTISPPNLSPAYNSLQGLFNLPPVF